MTNILHIFVMTNSQQILQDAIYACIINRKKRALCCVASSVQYKISKLKQIQPNAQTEERWVINWNETS